jgi:cellulose synthase/poly-beta-1,6-N-acetylglucosamine synthase-like glycosyltransferase
MNGLELTFWLCLACVFYTYFGYPLFVGLWAARRGRPVRRGAFQGSFAVVVAAHNEEANIVRRLQELRRHVSRAGGGELVLAADGCSDRTAELALALAQEQGPPIRVLAWPENRGKATALTSAVAATASEIVVFADTRQSWADDAIPALLSNFADPEVGAVSGDLVLQEANGALAGVGIYWRLEKWLRKKESLVHAQVGVTGAISAVRRTLFRPIPAGTLLDDVYWPLCVALEGHRVVHDETAKAFDRLPERSSAEFRRKVRTLAGNYQLVALLPRALLPWRNPVWPAFVSHKLLRLVGPWALLGLLVSSALLGGLGYTLFLEAQLACYALALLGLIPALGRGRLSSAAVSFLVLNAAAACGFWVWLLGRSASAWRKVDYRPLAPVAEPATTESMIGSN